MALAPALVSAEVSYCCEKTTSGAWCQNAPLESCDPEFRTNPTSCEATSYCKMGTCVDSQEGTCLENTPQQVCETSNGVWTEGDSGEIGRCQLGCCLMGDQAAFVTQTRCKRLSSIYSLDVDFREDMKDELQCIASATSEVIGACVYEEEFTTTCTLTSQSECDDMSTDETDIAFHQGFLCSDETLGTDCGPTEETTCVEGEDVVRFLDSCGNLANVYDASKLKNKLYWSKIVDETESCNYGDSNADNGKCGNCDYLRGSTCKEFKRGEDRVRPDYGNNICRDLSCDFEGEEYQHGETWCADAEGLEDSAPGSRYFRLMCYNGEVQTEPCADYRQEICLQDEVNEFRTAACRVNMWQDCYSQETIDDCLNSDKRDCRWQQGLILSSPEIDESTAQSDTQEQFTPAATEAAPTTAFPAPPAEEPPPSLSPPYAPITGNFLAGILGGTEVGETIESAQDAIQEYGACVPIYSPGFDFWQEGNSDQICQMATQECVVTYEKKLVGGKRKCAENCWCLDPIIRTTFIAGCNTLGDCGLKENYLGEMGLGNTNVETVEDDEDDK